MSEADKIIKSLRDSGKKVEEFYMSNKTSDKNVANIQEDVKYVKEMLEIARVFFKAVKAETDYKKDVDEIAFCNAIENILAEREQMLKERDVANDSVIAHKFAVMQQQLEQKDKRIQELEEEVLDERERAMHHEEDYQKAKDEQKIIMANSIPNQVVIDAINKHKLAYEELGIKYTNTHYDDNEIRARDFYMTVTEDRIVHVLQELLEGGK